MTSTMSTWHIRDGTDTTGPWLKTLADLTGTWK